MMSIIRPYIPHTLMGISNAVPRSTIKSEEDVKAVILANQESKKKQQRKGCKSKGRIATTPTKPTNRLANYIPTHDLGKPRRGPGSPPARIQKQRSAGAWGGRLRILYTQNVDSPNLLPVEMDIDYDEDRYWHMMTPTDFSANFYSSMYTGCDFDTPMEDAPSLTWLMSSIACALPIGGDSYCDVEMVDLR